MDTQKEAIFFTRKYIKRFTPISRRRVVLFVWHPFPVFLTTKESRFVIVFISTRRYHGFYELIYFGVGGHLA